MEHFNFDLPADVFVAGRRLGRQSPVSYRRFATGAEAVRYAIELLSPDKLPGAVVEADGGRFTSQAIRQLYEHPDYPLERRAHAD